MTTNTTMKDINKVMKELAEMSALEKELQMTIESLKDEVKDYMKANELDEVLSEDGYKATWRDVDSMRISSKDLKREMPEIWARFAKLTTSKRFTFC